MKKSIGGNRLGSGNKMQTDLHNYSRSTHNLTEEFTTAMNVGTLVPFYCNLGLNGDTFDIDLEAMIRTIPTTGPLFGSFKCQMDVFQVPIRLYQGILHNNPINIGLKMSQVKFPILRIRHNADTDNDGTRNQRYAQVSTNSLAKYLGLSGLGYNVTAGTQRNPVIERTFNAIPFLAYYDIFKQYYANKQEENAYVITPTKGEAPKIIKDLAVYTSQGVETYPYQEADECISFEIPNQMLLVNFGLFAEGISARNVYLISPERNETSLTQIVADGYGTIHETTKENLLNFTINKEFFDQFLIGTWEMRFNGDPIYSNEINLQPFKLENIDRMRQDILRETELGTSFEVGEYLPYKTLVDQTEDGRSLNAYNMNGLVVKTYQSDIYNNWLNTEWIDGDNGIAAITSVDTSGGGFTIDALNLANKVYNMLNRIAVSGGTYEDWQEAVFGEEALRHAESPIYCGGMSTEVVFEEVVQTAPAVTDDVQSYTGSLAGKGRAINRKGGHIIIHVKEPSFIIGLVSLTPRINYGDGNAWYLTELYSADDVHKPALDAIGFQNLMTEQMDWRDTQIEGSTHGQTIHRYAIGKTPAWMNYMTSVNKVFSDFLDKYNFMVLKRDYDYDERRGRIEDFTTYIDPRKYNYAFADTSLSAQNFWVQIATRVIARRKMSAKVIPNL